MKISNIQNKGSMQESEQRAKSTEKQPIVNKDVKFYIGIDPGVKTGIAVWSKKERRFFHIDTVELHVAMAFVEKFTSNKSTLHVRVEDARKRKYFGNSGREKLQGAGSVKRDCSCWQEFLEYHKISFDMPSPKQKGAKVTAEYFKKLTGWEKRCSQHARDAAILVFGL